MRLFIALDAPEGWRDAATAAQDQLRDRFDSQLRFVRREHFHVTVRFLGEVGSDAADALGAAIEAMPPFEVDAGLAPAGTFGSAPRTSVAWLGIELSDSRRLLATVDDAIRVAGLTPPDQAWRPHLTLARVRRHIDASGRRAVAAAVEALPPPEAQTGAIRGVSLFHSHLGNRAPSHKLLARSAVS